MQGNKADIFDNTTLPFIWFQFPPLLLSISTFPSSHTPFRYDFLILFLISPHFLFSFIWVDKKENMEEVYRNTRRHNMVI
jgi:hypothetical protein